VDQVLYERNGQIATITLNRPEKMNALTGEMMARLGDLWHEVDADDAVRVAIITGAGERAFCSGRDLMADAPGGPAYHRQRKAQGLETEDTGMEVAMPAAVRKPVIAAVNGHCLAAGFALALACDLRLASENARLGTSTVNRGLIAGGGQSQRLVRYLPFGIAMEMLLYGHPLDAQRALQYGLINTVVPLEQLRGTAQDWAERLCRNAPLAVQATKELAYRGALDLHFNEAMRLENQRYNDMLETEDVLEGARAFAERREPNFQGR
jgi:enoyl-CoA hydratase/carnithine racemase